MSVRLNYTSEDYLKFIVNIKKMYTFAVRFLNKQKPVQNTVKNT